MPKGIPKSGINKGWFKKGNIPIYPIKKGEHRSMKTEFKKGIIPKNAIKKGEHRSMKTEFKKGSNPWNKGTLYGKNNNLLSKIKQSKKYDNWRNKIFKRDNYKCVICNSKKQINAHHIIPIKIIYENFLKKHKNIKQEELYKLSKNYEMFWKLKNGITLCFNCHKKMHNWN